MRRDDDRWQLEAVQRVISLGTSGCDMSPLFPEMIMVSIIIIIDSYHWVSYWATVLHSLEFFSSLKGSVSVVRQVLVVALLLYM